MQIRLYSIIFLLGILLTSCYNEKKIHKPENLIEQEKMAIIISDFTLLEATMNTVAANKALVDSTLKVNLFEEHKISTEQFNESLLYYSKKPEEMKAIQEQVIEIIVEKKNSKK